MVRVLVVDDSTFMRSAIAALLEKDPEISVCGTAKDGQDCLAKAAQLQPDIITLDVEMPRMDGLTTLKELMRTNPLPVLMVSSLTAEGAETTLKALEYGALDFIAKVSGADQEDFGTELRHKVKSIARRKAFLRLRYTRTNLESGRSGVTGVAGLSAPATGVAGNAVAGAGMTRGVKTALSAGRSATVPLGGHAGGGATGNGQRPSTRPAAPVFPSAAASHAGGTGSASASPAFSSTAAAHAGGASSASASTIIHPCTGTHDIVVIGVSTGGPPVVQKILSSLPADFPACILVAQHMPASFTGPFAKRLDGVCRLKVTEAVNGDKIQNGRAYVCPGGKHIGIQMRGPLPEVLVTTEPTSALYKPSVNVLMETAGNGLGRRVLGVMLTGMGSDGCDGARVLKQRGGYLIAQNEASCVVYGMPKAVVDAGLADQILDVEDIAKAIMACVKGC
ncbi:chemotaxis response regulator protein-glutamate methylesterase [uncultured Desulfovibrio sp.]|uniref:Protein-glutamate methylesterase/protein-glutamine glutaminase n=1 Tax=Candidatus Desulfovibrio intestinavium TaxID=2838534 RepID=A0A9D2KR39_9BACT|nr:chemotaxis response regulator protein-glutamate methylesterase [uncultured Desulfovibrio sp.]HJA79184.1 chemotaxis response regulator protein-glutamate methylesterase [Candidatus Desulfovibrio intestinavium]